MRRHSGRHAAACAALIAFAAPAALAQGEEHPRTPWGDPDFTGSYSEYTTAPVERPEEFGDREFHTDEEFAAIEAARLAPEEPGYVGPDVTGTEADIHYDFDTYALSMNEGYSSPNRRTSIVTMPANGRIPPLLPQAEARREARAEWRRGREYDGPEFRGLTERCVAYPAATAPLLPAGYNSNLEIFQSPGQVLIRGEMGDPRIIPIGEGGLPDDLLPQWNGTSAGHWEGDTLVIETAGFHPDLVWRESSEHRRVVERITRIDEDTLEYAFTVEDPETWAEPWGGVYPLTEMPDQILFEMACTEGNYGMANILSGERAGEAEAAAE